MTTDHIPDATKMVPEALRLAGHLERFRSFPDDLAAAAELRRLHTENKTLKAAQQECGFGAGCCYQAAKAEADEALLRQALEALEYCRSGEDCHPTPTSEAIDALRERLQ